MYDLFRLHAQARASALVDAPAVADTVFSPAVGTPLEPEQVASFMQ